MGPALHSNSELNVWWAPATLPAICMLSNALHELGMLLPNSSWDDRECVAGCAARIPDLDRGILLFAVFHHILQCAVPQFAEFTIQKMRPSEEWQDGIAAVLHFVAGLLQSCIFAE